MNVGKIWIVLVFSLMWGQFLNIVEAVGPLWLITQSSKRRWLGWEGFKVIFTAAKNISYPSLAQLVASLAENVKTFGLTFEQRSLIEYFFFFVFRFKLLRQF